jgi:glucose-1-phosphate adenylyltransferase
LRSTSELHPPVKFVFDEEGRRGHAIDSIISSGCILSGGFVRNSVLGRAVRVHAGAVVEDSIIFDYCDIGRHARVRRAILDKNARVADHTTVGYDLEKDRRSHHVTESGIVILAGARSSVEVATLDLRKIVEKRKKRAEPA